MTKNRPRRKRFAWITLAGAGVLAIGSASAYTLWFGRKPYATTPSAGREQADSTFHKRPAYPYSVVPGGVYSAEEFSDAAAHDAVVAAHYLIINGSRLRSTRLESSRSAYLSYRVNNAIFWTKRPVNLPRGERVLSDGECLLRARCGNRISAVLRSPVLAVEPDEIIAEQNESALVQEPLAKLRVPGFAQLFQPPIRSSVDPPDSESGKSLPAIITLLPGTGTPAVGGKGPPSSGGGGMPPGIGTGTGPGIGTGTPPVIGTGTPPVEGKGTPPTVGTGTPPIVGTGTPPTGGTGTPPTGGGGAPLSGGTGKPPVTGTGTPPVGGKGTQLGGGGGTPLGGGGGTPPAGGTGTPSITGTGGSLPDPKNTPQDPVIESTGPRPGEIFWPGEPGDRSPKSPLAPVVTVVPEPSSWILLGSIMLLFARTLTRRKRV